MFGSLGFAEVAMIVGILIVLFGAKQLPKLGKAFAETITEFKGAWRQVTDVKDEAVDAMKDVEDEARDAVGAPPKRRRRG